MKISLRQLRLRQGAFNLEIDVEISGQVVGIFGPSGAGKTSLVEMMAGLRRPDAGRIALDDLVLADHAQRIFVQPEKRGVGYVPQDLALFPHLSVLKNILYGRSAATRTATSLELDPIVQLLEIEPLLERSVAQLSGGQKQRVAFARALLAHPRLLLLDEPLASLDRELKLRILPYLRRIRDELGLPMLYVSHAPEEMFSLCDQIMVLHDGRCLRVSPPDELFEKSTTVALRPGVLP